MDAASNTPAPFPPPAAADAPRSSPWPVSAQTALILLLTAAFFYLLGRWSRDHAEAPRPVYLLAGADPDRQLDLNRATRAELRLLPGVGETLAERIMDHREQRGPFRRVEDLRGVSGVGPKALQRLRPWLTVAGADGNDLGEASEPPPPGPPAPRATTPRKQTALSAPIDINRAELIDLQKLPGIGPKLSQRIVDERTVRGPFKAVDELRRVPGIGPKTLERLRPHVTVGPGKSGPPTASPATRTAYNE